MIQETYCTEDIDIIIDAERCVSLVNMIDTFVVLDMMTK